MNSHSVTLSSFVENGGPLHARTAFIHSCMEASNTTCTSEGAGLALLWRLLKSCWWAASSEAHGWLFANNLGAGINGCSAVRDACARWAGLSSDSQVARQGAWRSKNGNGHAINNSAGAILSGHRCALCCIQT